MPELWAKLECDSAISAMLFSCYHIVSTRYAWHSPLHFYLSSTLRRRPRPFDTSGITCWLESPILSEPSSSQRVFGILSPYRSLSPHLTDFDSFLCFLWKITRQAKTGHVEHSVRSQFMTQHGTFRLRGNRLRCTREILIEWREWYMTHLTILRTCFNHLWIAMLCHVMWLTLSVNWYPWSVPTWRDKAEAQRVSFSFDLSQVDDGM